MSIIIVGNGFIASHLPYKVADFRLDKTNIKTFIEQHKPDTIINCIAFCGGKKTIDECESQKSRTYIANVVIPLLLAEECNKKDIHLISIGSGCIFNGKSPNIENNIDIGWNENDYANPVSYYSRTKYATDIALGELDNTTILRIRMPISNKNHPRNLISKLLRYENIIDYPNSVSFTDDIANAVEHSIKNYKTGVYHITNSLPLLHSELLEEYKKYFPDHKYKSINVDELNNITVAKRSNCILDNRKALQDGFSFGDTHTRVKETIKSFIEGN